MFQFTVRTKTRTEFVDITGLVRDAVGKADPRTGAVVVYCPHTTAAVTIQENADPDVPRDMMHFLNAAVPKDTPGFRHREGNSDAHLKASLIGSSVTVLVADGRLVFGTWQGVFFCEFDGPRDRTVLVQPVAGVGPPAGGAV